MSDTDTNSDTAAGRASIDVAALASAAMERIAEHAITHPLRTLGIAAGVGYTLGGGLPKFVVRIGMIFGARVITNAIVSASLERLGGTTPDDDDDGPRAPARDVGAPDGAGKRRATKRGDDRRAGASPVAESRD